MTTRKRDTGLRLRRAAIVLISRNGYEATSTDDIAREAGVSPRTFFNYFPTKESVVLLPDGMIASVVAGILASRPPHEDPVASMAATAVITFEALRLVVEAEDALLLTALRVALREPALRRILVERRAMVEDAAWETLLQRGTAPRDLSTRVALSSVVNTAFLALQRWATSDSTISLQAMLARCLLRAPDPTRLAAGVNAARR